MIIDISRTVAPGVAVYPGDEPLGVDTVCDVSDESPCRITSLQNWTTHFLTHVDPPRHFIAAGATLDDVSLDRFTGSTTVVGVSGDAVHASDVPSGLEGRNVLFKTRNSTLDPRQFHEDHVYVAADAVAA